MPFPAKIWMAGVIGARDPIAMESGEFVWTEELRDFPSTNDTVRVILGRVLELLIEAIVAAGAFVLNSMDHSKKDRSRSFFGKEC